MKKSLVYLLASLVVLMFTVPASAEIEWSGNISAGIEKLSYGTDTGVNDELQFTDAKVNLNLKTEIADGVTAVVEVVRNSENNMTMESRRIELTNLIPNATLMVGRLPFPMGKETDSQTENASMMKNAMIDNSALADMEVTGDVLDYGIALKTTMGPVNCLLAITNGNNGIASDNNSDKAMMLRLDGDVEAVPGLSLAGSYLTNDAAGANQTNEETTMVLDAAYKTEALGIAVTYGEKETKELTKIELDCLAIEVSYVCTDACSVAVRQSKVDSKEAGVDTAEVTKLQVGVNYNLAENTLLKLEYVDNNYKEKPTDEKSPSDYDGIKAAIVVKF